MLCEPCVVLVYVHCGARRLLKHPHFVILLRQTLAKQSRKKRTLHWLMGAPVAGRDGGRVRAEEDGEIDVGGEDDLTLEQQQAS
eukprot:7592261-Pyramimonas_sp.AAC.1